MENILNSIYILGGMGVILGSALAVSSKRSRTSAAKSQTGTEAEEEAGIRRLARIKCSGTKKVIRTKYKYEGISDCVAASKLIGGPKLCPYACLGLGTCVASCPHDAIELTDGIASVDSRKCQSCRTCIDACPKRVIHMVPDSGKPWVKCSSRNQEAVVRQICDKGCIGCGDCISACEFDAVKIENDLAQIDQVKCRNCAACLAKCPRRTISS